MKSRSTVSLETGYVVVEWYPLLGLDGARVQVGGRISEAARRTSGEAERRDVPETSSACCTIYRGLESLAGQREKTTHSPWCVVCTGKEDEGSAPPVWSSLRHVSISM